MKIKQLTLDGSKDGKRFLILINGEEHWIQGRSFIILTQLAHIAKKRGCCSRKELSVRDENLYGQLLKLRKEGLTIETDGTERYWLKVEPNSIRFNRENLKNHYDYRVRRLFE
jgi:hypothetical protein